MERNKGRSRRVAAQQGPTPKWYAVFKGSTLTGEAREEALRCIDDMRNTRGPVRGELYGTGPWFAVKVSQSGVVKRVPPDAIGPYLTPHITLEAAYCLNTICPDGIGATEKGRVESKVEEQLKMDLPEVKV